MEASEVAMIVGETVRACLKQFTLSPLLTIDEIAEKLKISKDAVRAYIRSGELKAYELGARLVRVEIAEVNEFLAKMQVRSQDSEPEKDRESARVQECEVAEPEKPEEDQGCIQCDAVHPKTGVRCTLEKGHEGKHCCRKEVAA